MNSKGGNIDEDKETDCSDERAYNSNGGFLSQRSDWSGYRITVYDELSYHSRGFLQICRAEIGRCFSAAWVLFSLGKQAKMAKGTRRDISLADSVDLVFHLLCAGDEFLVFIIDRCTEV